MRSEGRGPCAGPSSLLLGKGRAWHHARHGRHSSINPAAWPEPWPPSPPAEFADWALAGSWNPASRDPSPSRRALSANGHVERNFEYVLVWRFRNSRARPLAALPNRPISCDSARIYFFGGLGRRRCRKRTPGPPPFSSMNSTPAASKARRTAKSLAAVIEVSSSVNSARRMVATLRSDRRARSSALQRRRDRAALIWALVSGLAILTRITAYAMIQIILDDVRHKPRSVANAIFNRGGRHEIAGVDKVVW